MISSLNILFYRIFKTDVISDGILFAKNDGWGNVRPIYGTATAGYVDVYAWCHLESSHDEVLPFGPSVVDEEMQFNFPNIYTAFEDFYISMVVKIIYFF